MTTPHSQQFSLYFGKQSHEIEAQTLADSISSFSTLLAQINKDLETGKGIDFKIKAFKAGSFEVPCEVLEILLAGVLSSPEANYLPTILKIAWEMIKLKLDLAGNPPREVRAQDNGTAIVNDKGNVTLVDNRTFNIFQNNKIAIGAVEKQFDALAHDEEVKDFKLLMEGEKAPLIDIPNEQFPIIAGQQEPLELLEQEEDKKVFIDRAKLNLLKVVFDKRYKWEFYNQGAKIAASIKDQSFLDRIASGERFAKGDVLVVQLRTNQVFDQTLNTFINKSYEILEVLEHIPRAQQLGLGV